MINFLEYDERNNKIYNEPNIKSAGRFFLNDYNDVVMVFVLLLLLNYDLRQYIVHCTI